MQVITALKIREADKLGLMIPSFSPICAAAITKESVDVNKMALPSTILRGYHLRRTSDGKSFEIKSPTIKIGIISILEGSLKIDQTSRFTPTITKKIGMKKPYPMESSFSTISSFGDNNDTSTPAKKAPKIFSAPTDSDNPTKIKISAKTARVSICTLPAFKLSKYGMFLKRFAIK